MNFFKKGIEYNRLAQAFNGIYVMLNELEVKTKDKYSYDRADLEQESFFIGYLCRKEILDRMDEYKWGMISPIFVPMISNGRITLTFAFQQTIGRLYYLSDSLSISQEINEILERGRAYHEIESSVPPHLKNKLF